MCANTNTASSPSRTPCTICAIDALITAEPKQPMHWTAREYAINDAAIEPDIYAALCEDHRNEVDEEVALADRD